MNKRTPPLFVLTSDGKNVLPPANVITAVCLDENVHLRLATATTPDFLRLRAWLQQIQRRPGHAFMASVALEHAMSHDKTCIDRVPTILREVSRAILGERQPPLRVDGEGTISGVISGLATRTLVGCAEIGWVRNAHYSGRRSPNPAEANIRAFLAWRRSTFPTVAQSTSTLLCVAALGGNEVAAAALKALKEDANWIRNGAFDAVHLDNFCDACSPARHWSFGPSVAVLVTGDAGMARAIDSFKSGWVGARGAALIEMRLHWVSKVRQARVRKDFPDWQPASRAPSISVDSAALLAVKEVCGEVPSKVQRLYLEAQTYRRRHRKDKA